MSRIDVAIVCVAQNSVSVVSSSSRGMPGASLHERHFSAIHAARPAGESLSPNATVCGLVDWIEL